METEISIAKIYDKLFVSIPLRFFKKNIITNLFNREENNKKRALVYFKTDPFFSSRLVKKFEHTNNFEILLITKILDQYGFIVDLIDRAATWDEVSALQNNKYALYIGNAAGNSAPHHTKILQNFVLQTKIAYVAGPEPELSNQLVNEQHENFRKRHKADCVVRRLVKGEHFDQRFKTIDAFLCVAGNTFSINSYKKKYQIPVYSLCAATSPHIQFRAHTMQNRKSNHFVYFGGNGNICKGLDLVLEAFDGETNCHLDICAPLSEKDFWQFYKTLLQRNPQIDVHGFVTVGSTIFNKIIDKATFLLFPSAAEGCAGSITTCMRAGIIPVINYEAGVDIGDYGIEIKDRSVTALKTLLRQLTKMPQEEIKSRSIKSYIKSFDFTESSYQKNFEAALLEILANNKII